MQQIAENEAVKVIVDHDDRGRRVSFIFKGDYASFHVSTEAHPIDSPRKSPAAFRGAVLGATPADLRDALTAWLDATEEGMPSR
jgi:hypothetical protein